MSATIHDDVIAILTKVLDRTPEAITAETPLTSLGVDSLGMVELIFDLEERFSISIPDSGRLAEMGLKMETVSELVDAVAELVRQRPNPS